MWEEVFSAKDRCKGAALTKEDTKGNIIPADDTMGPSQLDDFVRGIAADTDRALAGMALRHPMEARIVVRCGGVAA